MLKKNKKIILLIIFIVIGLTLILSGIFFAMNNDRIDDNNSSNNNPSNNEINPKEVLEKLSIDKFLVRYFTNTTEVNKNLLDISSEMSVIYYFLVNDSIEKYTLVYENPLKVDTLYVKYNDFITNSKKYFDSEPKYHYQSTTMEFSNLTKMEDGRYSTILDEAHVCDFKADTSNCYVLMGGANEHNYELGSVEFSDLKINDNIITGYVKKYYEPNNKNLYIDSTFAFEFEEVDNRYVIKSLKITG